MKQNEILDRDLLSSQLPVTDLQSNKNRLIRHKIVDTVQGCQMVYFQTKNSKLGKFWRALERKRLEFSRAVWNRLRPFGIFYGQLVI
jgi:hypothetical protein